MIVVVLWILNMDVNYLEGSKFRWCVVEVTIIIRLNTNLANTFIENNVILI